MLNKNVKAYIYVFGIVTQMWLIIEPFSDLVHWQIETLMLTFRGY